MQYDPSKSGIYLRSDSVTSQKSHILLKVFLDSLTDMLHRRPRSCMLGLFCLFKAWMQTCYTDVGSAWGVVENVSECRNLAVVCLWCVQGACFSSADSLRVLWLHLAAHVLLFSVFSSQCAGSLNMIALHKRQAPVLTTHDTVSHAWSLTTMPLLCLHGMMLR